MEQKIIFQSQEQCIYLMKEKNLDFYLIIPNNKQVSLILGLFPDITEEQIKALPKEKDKAIVIPVISSNILTTANHLDGTTLKYIDNILSYLINISYKVLTHNHLIVNQKILLNNNIAYENFNKQYIEKYQGRVELYNLIPTPKPTNEPIFKNLNSIIEDQSKSIESKVKETESKKDEIEEMVDPILSDEPVVVTEELKGKKEPGFVSYVLLGVLVAVLSLVFLYILL